MNDDLDRLLQCSGHAVSRAQVLHHVSRHVLDRTLSSGQLVALLPKTYVRRELAADIVVRERAALLYAGEHAALSHISALRRWDLPVPTPLFAGPVHVTLPHQVRCRSRVGAIIVHRTVESLGVLRRSGTPLTRLERSIVDSWPLLDGAHQRAPAILAVSERRTTPQRLLFEAMRTSNLKGRASLLELCAALADGCRSELEVWGLRHVFRKDRRLTHGVRQHPVAIGNRTAYLDLAFVKEWVAVELDGAAFHHRDLAQRERDMRRDAALSARGWVVLRVSYWRLHDEPDVVCDEIAAVLAMRRRQLAA